MAKKVGILGGTFNPVHLGHIILAYDAMEHFRLDELLFLPCSSPPHKQARNMALAGHRLAMLKAAVRPEPRFKVLSLEIERGGKSYSVDTLKALKAERPSDRFFFVIGADMLLELHTWKNVYELLELCEFVTMDRPGSSLKSLRRGGLKLHAPWPGRLRKNIFKGHRVDISSSEIRKRVAKGRPFRHLVPPAVERYILANKLYRTKESRRSKR